MNLNNKTILLVISGGIGAYKSLELIRLLKKSGAQIRCILTKGGEQFVTPLSVSALCEHQAYTDLWSLKDEQAPNQDESLNTIKNTQRQAPLPYQNKNDTMAHIRLSREADAIIIAPASADFLAKMANGTANDLASTTLLAANKRALIAHAMNHQMWHNPATQRNIATLKADGHQFIGPTEGVMACNENGLGRMSEPEDIHAAIADFLSINPKKQPNENKEHDSTSGDLRPNLVNKKHVTFDNNHIIKNKPLQGYSALLTSGPTFEPLDPVRFIGNRSSGKQGHAIAQALQKAGANVTLITGPVALPDPVDVKTLHVETAAEMLEFAIHNLPADIAICAAAVSDWSAAEEQDHKIKKRTDDTPPTLKLKENPDILHTISTHKHRPALVIGFAAETQDLLKNAKAKRTNKGCDWILANDVGKSKKIKKQKVFGEDENHVYLISENNTAQEWPRASKTEIAQKLVHTIIKHINTEKNT